MIRPATGEDAVRVGELVRAAYAGYPERMGGAKPRPMTQDYADVIRDLDAHVVERDGEVVGFLALEDDPSESLFIDNVAVDPAHHGKGVGRALLEHAEAEARRRGKTAIALFTHSTMTENLALYERIGYVEYARRPVEPGELVFMRKPL